MPKHGRPSAKTHALHLKREKKLEDDMDAGPKAVAVAAPPAAVSSLQRKTRRFESLRLTPCSQGAAGKLAKPREAKEAAGRVIYIGACC